MATLNCKVCGKAVAATRMSRHTADHYSRRPVLARLASQKRLPVKVEQKVFGRA